MKKIMGSVDEKDSGSHFRSSVIQIKDDTHRNEMPLTACWRLACLQ